MIGYLEPHDRPETSGARRWARGDPAPAQHASAGVELAEMDVDAVIARAPELALVDELAHTNLPEARNRKRYEDIDEILAAGIAVTSTVNIQHLESLNDEVFELTGVRVRETFPDRILDEADEVVLVDLAPEALQERLRDGKVYAPDAGRGGARRTSSGSRTSRRCASSSCASSPRTSRRGGRTAVLDPLSQQAVAERILVLVTPEPRSQRILRRAFRSGQRLGSEIDAVWVRRPGQQLTEAESVSLAALRRLASILGAHFIELEGDEPARGGEAVRRRARLDLCLRRHARRVAPHGDPPRLARLEARARAARRRHPRRRRPGAARGAASDDLGAPRRGRRSSRLVAWRSALGAGAGRRPGTARRPDPRAVHRRRARPDACSRPRSGSRAPRRRRSCPPT